MAVVVVGTRAGAPDSLDDVIALKGPETELTAAGPVKQYGFWVRSSAEHREHFIQRLEPLLERAYGAAGHHALFALNEALMNVEEHAHKNDVNKVAYTQLFLRPNAIVWSVHYDASPFDPRNVRVSPVNPDGTFHNKPRGRGHIMMTKLSDGLAYPVSYEDPERKERPWVSDTYGMTLVR